jgi:ribosomal protein S18 acetylase RimI-like enzyme
MLESPMIFEAFDPQALADWLVASRADYVKERIAAGDSPREAEGNATRSFEQLVPGGSPAPGQLMGRLCIAGETVGHLWIGPAGSDPKRWWVWDIAVKTDMRGRGLGREAMLLGEQLARSNGATSIGLNVFGHNRVARALYTSLGYEESAVVMRKPL